MHQLEGRLAELYAILAGGGEFTYDDLLRELGLESERHVLRLLDELREQGIEVYESRQERKKLFSLAPRHDITASLLELDEREILALAVASEASLPALAPTPLGAPLDRAFRKLLDQLRAEIFTFDINEELEHWHFGGGGASGINPEIFDALTDAISDHRRVRIDYVTASTGKESIGRLIEPYALAVRGGTWLVVAYCCRRREMRDFALAGITRVVPSDPAAEPGAIFTRPEEFDLDVYFAERFSALAGDEVYTARLLVEPERAIYFKRKRYHPTQHIEDTPRNDGRIVVSFRASSLEEMRSFAGGWGAGVTVLEPAELVEMMRREVAELAARYTPNRDALHGDEAPVDESSVKGSHTDGAS